MCADMKVQHASALAPSVPRQNSFCERELELLVSGRVYTGRTNNRRLGKSNVCCSDLGCNSFERSINRSWSNKSKLEPHHKQSGRSALS
eukprot:4549950-Amphidinium_carterae.1